MRALAAIAWAAGIVHAAAFGAHREEGPAAASFFAALAGSQVAWGARIWARPSGRALLVGAAGSPRRGRHR